MVIYGINAVREALESATGIKEIYIADRMDSRVREILDHASRKHIRVVKKPREFFREGPQASQLIGAAIEIRLIPFDTLLETEKRAGGVFVVLDLIEDPRNLGAILRTALAAGVDGVVIQSHRACGITPTVFAASAGAVSHLRISEVPNIKNSLRAFRDEGYGIIGADAKGGKDHWEADFSGPTVLVMGSEGKGMRRTVRDLCDEIVRIPMAGKVASLNVSVATGVILFEIVRQRRGTVKFT